MAKPCSRPPYFRPLKTMDGEILASNHNMLKLVATLGLPLPPVRQTPPSRRSPRCCSGRLKRQWDRQNHVRAEVLPKHVMVGHHRSVKAKALRTILPRRFDQRPNLRHERYVVPLRNRDLRSANPATLPNSQLVVICHPQCLPSEEFYLRSRAFVILSFLICPNSRQVTIGMLFAFCTAGGSSMTLAMDAVAHYINTFIWCGETERTLDA